MYDNINDDDRLPVGQFWIACHIFSVILSVIKLFGDLEEIPWWIVSAPFLIDILLATILTTSLLVLILLSDRFKR